MPTAPKVYATIVADDQTYNLTTEINFLNLTLPVTTSIGSFELKIPHGALKDFSRYHDANVFKSVDIWLGTDSTGSAKKFSGKVDSFKGEFNAQSGYLIDFMGRDLGEALFRHKITKDYFGYTFLNPSKRRGSTTGGYDVYSLENFTGSIPDATTTINVGTTGSFYFFVKPYAFINTPYGSDLPVAIEGTGSVTLFDFTTTGSQFELHLKLINSGSSAHSGYIVAKLRFVDDTGSLANPTALTGWATGSTIDFPAFPNYVLNDIIYLTATRNCPTKFIELEMLWKCTVSGSDTDAGLQIEMSQGSFLKIPNDNGLATNVVNDILSGSGISTGSVPWDDTPLTHSYYNEPAFNALRDIADIVSWDTKTDVNGLWQAWTRRSNTAGGTLQTGSNIIKFSRVKDVDNVKNNVSVRGAPEALFPYDGDWWTESSGSGWTLVSGSLTEGKNVSALPSVVGARYISGSSNDIVSKWLIIRHTIDPSLNLTNNENITLAFWTAGGTIWTNVDSIHQVRLKRDATDERNYFYAQLKTLTGGTTWTDNSFELGFGNVTGSSQAGDWTKIGNMNWQDIRCIEFYLWYTGITAGPTFYIDGLRFENLRFTGSAIDATSTGSYGNRPYEEISDYFHSYKECQDRAEEILSLGKYPMNQFTVLTTGSEAINGGDRIYLLLPSEGVTPATYYDVLEVNHMVSSQEGFVTNLTLGDRVEIRDVAQLQSYGIQRAYSKKDINDALKGKKVYF